MAPKGNHKCGRCAYCRMMETSSVLNIGRIQWRVNQLITCRSDFLVYILFCPCGFYHIGKTKRPLWKRVSEHMYSLKTGKGAPHLINHMRTCHDNNPNLLRFAGLQRIFVPVKTDINSYYAVKRSRFLIVTQWVFWVLMIVMIWLRSYNHVLYVFNNHVLYFV